MEGRQTIAIKLSGMVATGLPVRYLGVHVIRVLGFKISKYLVQLGPCLLLVKYLADSYCPSTCKYLENLVFK